MKRVISLLLLLSTFLLFSCGGDNENPTRVYETIDLRYPITTKSSVSVAAIGDFSEVVVYNLSVTVTGNDALQDKIEDKLLEFYCLIEKIASNLYADVMKNIFDVNGVSEITFGCFDTYLRGGLFSVGCYVIYDNYGEVGTVYLGGATWNLETGEEVTLDELMTLDEGEFDNFLTMSFSTLVNAFTDYYPTPTANTRYRDNLSFYLTDEGVVMFLCYELQKIHLNAFAVELDYADYDEFFRYNFAKR